jgi:hypothetical protein
MFLPAMTILETSISALAGGGGGRFQASRTYRRNRTGSTCLEVEQNGDSQMTFSVLPTTSDGTGGSSLSIVTSLRAGHRIAVRFPTEARHFSILHNAQTDSAH